MSDDSFDVFISYAHADSDSFATELYQHLKANGISAWLDRDDLKSRGLPWQAEVRDSVDHAERVIALVSPRATESPHVRSEWDGARCSGHVVIPVLYGDVPDALPEVLASTSLEFFDFRGLRADAYAKTMARLVDSIRAPAPRLGRMHTVPYPPPNLYTRVADLARIQDLVLKYPVTVIHGMGGLGKSVVAAEYAWEAETRRTFDDGIVWLDAGAGGDKVLDNFFALAEAFEEPSKLDPATYQSVIGAPMALRKLLANKTGLIIIDDASDVKSVKPLTDVLGPRCQVLVTTRDRGLAQRLQAARAELEFLGPAAAKELLSRWWQRPVAELPPEADEIVERCDGLPLALAMVGAMVADPDAPYDWPAALRALKSAAQQTLTRRFDYKYDSLNASIRASVKALGPHEDRYLDFAVFQDDTAVPEATLHTYWAPKGLSEWDVKELIELFVKRSLLRLNPDGAVTAHDLQLDYTRYEVEKVASTCKLAARHRCLVEAYGESWVQGPAEGRGYYFRFVPYHMIEAEMEDQLEALLRNHDFLRAKREATSHWDVVADYERLAQAKGLKRSGVDELFTATAPGTSESKIAILRDLALSYELLGHRLQAEKALLRAESLASDLKDDLVRAGILTQLGTSRFHRGAFDSTADALAEASRIYEQFEGTLNARQLGDYAECLDWSAELHRNVSEYDAALPLHERARDVAKRAGDGRREAHAVANIGAVYYWQNDYATALARWNECLELSKRIKDAAGEVHYCIDVGYMTFLVSHDLEAYDEALNLLNTGIDLAVEGRFEEEHARGLMNKASVLFVSGDMERLTEVEALYRSALDISESDDIARLTWRIHHNLGNVFRRRGDLDQAGAAYAQAMGSVLALRDACETEEKKESFLEHRVQPFQSMILVHLLRHDSAAARRLAAEHSLLTGYVASRERSVDLEEEERKCGNKRFFRLDGEDYYVETE